ncbi:MAG TPA: hypothetical protein VML01_10500 [Bryobacterales bacterium]|nr:hypothetical protein [Bryobacterales bacterium]
MQNSSNDSSGLVVSYLTLRKAIGLLGTLLPLVLLVGGLVLFRTGIQSSLSAYYHTGMGDVFVGTLCAIGVFLWAYKGYTDGAHNDARVSNFAGLFAIGVALFPTDPSGDPGVPRTLAGITHVVFAAAFFLTLAYFVLVLFRKSHSGRSRTAIKKTRDRVYRVTGYAILGSIALIGILGGIGALGLVPREVVQAWHPNFWLESIAVIAFGIAWAVKGQALLADPAE